MERKSTSRCFFNLGSTMITWFSRKETFVAPFSIEEEYMGMSMTSCECI
jgi:hypothetical protein